MIPTFYNSLNQREGQGVAFGEDILYYTDRQTNRWTDRQGDPRVPSGTSLDRTFFTFLNDLCLREGQGVVLGRDLLYGASVQNLWLEEHTGVRVPDAAQQEAFGLVGASRDNNLLVKRFNVSKFIKVW